LDHTQQATAICVFGFKLLVIPIVIWTDMPKVEYMCMKVLRLFCLIFYFEKY